MKTSKSLSIGFAGLLLSLSGPTYAYSNPTADIAWSGGTLGVADIQAAFNNARTTENSQLSTSIPTLTLPSQAQWDSKSDGEKALWLINKERTDRGIKALQGLETNVTNVAQSYAQYLLDNNKTGHEADGKTPSQRLDANPTIQACREFLTRSENLAYFWGISAFQTPLPIEKAVYDWMYEDALSSWGHRDAVLIDAYNDNNSDNQEGFLGIGRASGGPHSSPSRSYNHVEIVVMNIFDPCASWASDSTAPTFASGYPKTANVTHNALDLLAKANENGKAHYIVLADGATAPSAAQVKAGQDSTGTAVAADKKGDFALAANTEATANLTGLAASTAYDIFVIAEDGGNNLTAVQKVDVTTPAAPSVPSTLPDLISYSFSAQETKTLPGTSTENNASSGSCNGTIKTEDQIGRLALVALFYQNFCYTDGRYNHNNYQVKRGTVIDSGNTLQFDAYQVYEPANKATEFLGSQHAVYYQFPTKEDYTVYRFEGNQFAKVLEITASQIDTTQFIQVANNGVILKVSQLTGSATYAFVPSNQRVSTFTELATGIEGARVKSTALGDVLKYRYTVNGTPFDTKLDFNQGPNTHSNVYSRTRQFFLVQKSTGQPGFVWQNKDDQSIQVTWLGSDFKSQTTVALPNSQSEDLAAAIHDASGSLYYLTIQSGSGADTETARTASLYKVNDNGQQLAKSTLDTSKTGLNMVKFGDQNIASLQYLNGKLGLIVGRQMHESSDGLNHQGAIAVVFDANSLNVDKNSMPLS